MQFQFITENPTFQKIMHKIFYAFQRIGFDFLPRSFYSSIPDVYHLHNRKEWRRQRNMTFIKGADIQEQSSCLREWCIQFSEEQKDLYQSTIDEVGYTGYGPIESDILYCFIRANKPKTIIQIGAGFTTQVILRAAHISGYRPRIVCVDPYPSKHLLKLAEENEIEILPVRAQELADSFFNQLGPGDFLFIDSTHTVSIDSEVNNIILEVLPNLSSGCHVHFHDIFLPYDYSPHILNTCFFWQESVLLHAFLTQNESYKINVCSSMLHYFSPATIKDIFKHYKPASLIDGLANEPLYSVHFPSATYIYKV